MAKFADECRGFLRKYTHAVLSTFLSSDSSYPFGSLVNYDVHPSGDIIIKIAVISEHYKNLKADPHASIFILEDADSGDKQASSRATFLVDFHEVQDNEVEAIRQSFLKTFPNTIPPEIEQGFRYWRGTVSRIRWIGGFGSMGWIGGDSYYQ